MDRTKEALAAHYDRRLSEIVFRAVRSDAIQRYYDVPLTIERARIDAVQMMIFTRDRRKGWAYLIARVPHVEVRRGLLRHEVEEVLRDPRIESDHLTVAEQMGELVGLSIDEIRSAKPLPTTRAALAGWINIARDYPWLAAYGGYAVLERTNMNSLFPEGGRAQVAMKKWKDYLGIEPERLVSQKVHTVADDDHNESAFDVLKHFARSEWDWEEICAAAEESMEYWQVFIGGVADAMARAE